MSWVDSISSLYASSGALFDVTVIDSLMVNFQNVWTPVIVMVNSADTVKRIGESTYKVRFNTTNGRATWQPRLIANAACSPDVTYFPFDQQVCDLTFTPWFQNTSIITLSLATNEWNMDKYDVNGVWSVDKTESKLSQDSNGYDVATFTITFSRNPMFFTINLVFPVLMLSLLSGLVFLLPPDSGERVGFAITCFLSFVVLLQTIMTSMPQTSSPMSLFCYYVILMMLFSGVLSIFNILLLKVYNSPQKNVPRLIVHFLEIIKCIKCKRLELMKRLRRLRHKNAVDDESQVSDDVDSQASTSQMMPAVKETKEDITYRARFDAKRVSNGVLPQPMIGTPLPNGAVPEKAAIPESISLPSKMVEKVNVKDELIDVPDDVDAKEAEIINDVGETEINWQAVGQSLDWFFFVAFIGIQTVFSVFFLVPIGSRA